MERKACIYIGNAAKYDPKNYYEIEGATVTDTGEVYLNGARLKEYHRAGYKYVRLPFGDKEKLCKVHRIVATTFRDICGEYNEVVNHLDEDKSNNNASNLRWTTNAENLAWGTINERRAKTIQKKREDREKMAQEMARKEKQRPVLFYLPEQELTPEEIVEYRRFIYAASTILGRE